MSDEQDRPRWRDRFGELAAESLDLAQLDNAALAADWDANEQLRQAEMARAVLDLLSVGADRAAVDEMVAELRARPNEWWGEIREGRTPPGNM